MNDKSNLAFRYARCCVCVSVCLCIVVIRVSGELFAAYLNGLSDHNIENTHYTYAVDTYIHGDAASMLRNIFICVQCVYIQ